MRIPEAEQRQGTLFWFGLAGKTGMLTPPPPNFGRGAQVRITNMMRETDKKLYKEKRGGNLAYTKVLCFSNFVSKCHKPNESSLASSIIKYCMETLAPREPATQNLLLEIPTFARNESSDVQVSSRISMAITC